MDLRGYEFYASSGLPVSGALVEVWDAVDGTPGGSAITSTTTTSNGRWEFTGLTNTPKDVKVTFGSGYRWYKGLAKVSLTNLLVGVGGITSLGNVGIGAAPSSTIGLTVSSAITASTQAYASQVAGTLSAAANNDTLFGTYIGPTYNATSHTGVAVYGLYVNNVTPSNWGQASTAGYGVRIVAPTGAATDNINLYLSGTPSGGTRNLSLLADGSAQITGNVGIGAAPVSNARLFTSGNVTASGGAAIDVDAASTLIASANGDLLFGMQIASNLQNGGFGGLSEYGVQVNPTYSTSGSVPIYRGVNVAANATGQAGSTKTGAYIGAQTGANNNNYGVYVEAPSGASGNNAGIGFDQTLGEKLMFYDGGAGAHYGHGVQASEMYVSVPTSSQFAVRGNNAAGVLAFRVTPGSTAANSSFGFYGHAGATQQTVSGSRGGNAALASLLTALSNTGLIVDSTTA